MGSLMLDCPLCCGKTFPSQKTLKYHLLSLTDNLYCPECSLRFDSLSLLVEHLGDICEQFNPIQSSIQEQNTPDKVRSQDNKVNTTEKTKNDCSIEANMNLDIPEEEKGHCNLAASDLDDSKVVISEFQENTSDNINLLNAKDMEGRLVSVQVLKSEDYADGSVQDLEVRLLESSTDGSILILSNTETQGSDNDEQLIQSQDELLSINSADAEVHTEDAQSSDEMYSCNSCGVSFTSVIDHIQNYHNDQEVVVEMTDEDGIVDESADDVAIIHVTNGEEEAEISDQQTVTASVPGETRRIIMQSGDIVTTQANIAESNDGCSNERWRAPQILNTLREEECLDRDGRWYTRKVVQIERFWDPSAVKTESLSEGSTFSVKGKLSENMETDDPNEEGVSVEAFLQAGGEIDVDDPNTSRIYHCTGCYTQFLTMPEFESHDCISTLGKYKCDHCPVTYNNSKSLCAHMKVHKALKTNDKRASIKRENNETPGEDDTNQNRLVGPFKCAVCDTVFPSNKSLRLHRRMHDPVRSRPMEGPVEYPPANENSLAERFHCLQCDKWIHIGYRRIHETVHTGQTEYNCDICNRKFHTKENLSMHMNVHNIEKVSNVKSEKTLPYECNYCNRQFARPHEKVKHERIHTGEKPHSCEICGKTFRVSYCLTLHMRTHTGARPYICNHCGKRFKAHSVYNHHMLTHSDVRAYKCPYCPKAFKTSVQLAGHKNSHTKPFSCTECNRPFASLYAVRVHMDTHKRQNNLKFICQLCGASYARAFALRDHLKAQHYIVEDSEEPEANVAALSIIPKEEDNVEMEKLVMTNSDGEIELNIEYSNSLPTAEEN